MFWIAILVLQLIGVNGGKTDFELPPLDGWYNNLLHPDWGAVDTPLLRRSKTAYSDGVYEPSGKNRPNPLDISKAVHRGPSGQPSYYGRTAMLVYFGQQIVEEIVDSQRPGCPIEYFNIPVSRNHTQFNPQGKDNLEMTFKRSRYDQRTGYSPNNPRQQLNEITPFLDGQVIYGPTRAWTDSIRALSGGRLAGTNPDNLPQSFPLNNDLRLPYANPPVAREHVLKPVTRFYTIGNPRGHENPFLLAYGILWFRWHNYEASRVLRENSSWDPVKDDEKIFNIARKRVTALFQKIVFYDWLPMWLNARMSKDQFKSEYPYKKDAASPNTLFDGYNPSIHPGIYQEFQSAAMRYGHTLLPPGLWRRFARIIEPLFGIQIRTGNCQEFLRSKAFGSGKEMAAMRLCNNFWNSREAVEEDLDSLFRGMASTVAEREDSVLVSDVTESLFGPLEFSRRDLAALNIQRGRDHGLSDYNTVREAYGLKRKKTWGDINQLYNVEAIKRLRDLYGDNVTKPDDVDLFTGGMLETIPEGPGELFQHIILDQFLRIRHGDRFWFENTEYSRLSAEELERTWNLELADIITEVTGVGYQQIQRNVFQFTDADKDNCKEQPAQLDTTGIYQGRDMLEPCTPLQHYDYFSGSEISFALTLLVTALSIPVTFLIMYFLAHRRQQSARAARSPPPPLQRTSSSNLNEFRVLEWIDWNTVERVITVVLEQSKLRIDVFDTKKMLLRFINVKSVAGKNNNVIEMHLSSDGKQNLLSMKLTGEHDLISRFFDHNERGKFVVAFEKFVKNFDIKVQSRVLVESYILRNAITRKHRQDKLNVFFQKVLDMFQGGINDLEEDTIAHLEETNRSSDTSDITGLELTQTEFADAFGLRPNSTFVEHMFLLVDEDRSGHVSFREFLKIFILLSSGDAENKIRLLFNMHDINRQGFLTEIDLQQMVKSLLDLSESEANDSKVKEFMTSIYKSAGLRYGSELRFTDFKRVFASDIYAKTLKRATLELNDSDGGATSNILNTTQSSNARMTQMRSTLLRGYSLAGTSSRSPFERHVSTVSSLSGEKGYNTFLRSNSGSRVKVGTHDLPKAPNGYQGIYFNAIRILETYKLQVFWLTLYCLILFGVFLERVYYYAVLRENGGLRRIAGHGITITRGAASAVMLTYATLMLTMCRNTITRLRETFLHRFIPFDSLHSFHQLVACFALSFTALHIICHAVNFYHVCTQPSTDLNCYFREYFRASHELASFGYWAYGTLTGLSGVILTALVIIMYVFATPFSRRHLFNAFWNTHKLYIPTYILLLLHGSVRLVQEPHFPWYFIGPAILFTLDSMISMKRCKVKIDVIKAELLPSDVLALRVKKPLGFEYLSGQWVRVSCSALGSREYHPFTMTSAPHENELSFHIRAVGPWTRNLRHVYDLNSLQGRCLPNLFLDGPFGEGHQDWYKYDVSVLIGGGIGVTPFASILKDIVHKSAMDVNIQCRKVYFLWVTRTQKQFEWVTDIIRSVEQTDSSSLVTVHIFVTQFKRKFDLRTTMLYICERHFQKVAGKSLFTGLQATTHFGRPKFQDFLESLKYEHTNVKRFGVFSCGPQPMTQSVERACAELNGYTGPVYYHHYENF